MNYHELQSYIGELQQSGFDVVPLQVQFYKKFSVPLFASIMALVSIPFAFLAGNRGAMAGVGLSLAIAIAYWSVPPSCQSDARAMAGEVKRRPDGKLIYFDGTCWTTKPMPPRDTPF